MGATLSPLWFSTNLVCFMHWITSSATAFWTFLDFWPSPVHRYGLRLLIVWLAGWKDPQLPVWEEDRFKRDFHSVFIICRGVECVVDNCCNECTDMDDVTLTDNVKHKLSLKRKLLSKRKLYP